MKSEFLAYLNRKLLLAFSLCLCISSASYGQLTCSTADGNSGFSNVSGIQMFPTSEDNSGYFIEPSDIGSSSWGFYANSGAQSNLYATFDFPVSIGDEISLGMDNGSIDPSGVVGCGLQNSAGQNLVEFYFAGGTSNYTINADGGPTDTGIPFTSGGLEISFVIQSASTIEIQVDVQGGSSHSFTVNMLPTGGSQAIGQIRMFNVNAGFGSSNNVFFNNLEVCQSIVDLDYDGILSDVDCDDNNNSIGLPTTLYADVDGDGFGDAGNSMVSCATPGYVTDNTDCDDSNASSYPGAAEVCDGLDNDCDGDVDEDIMFIDWYVDNDNDGYGAGAPISDCVQPAGTVAINGDCDDSNPAINPADNDGDGYSTCQGDCDDTNAALNPADSDGDGYSTCDGDCDDNDPNLTPADNDGDGYSACQGDCDDSNAALNPADSDGDGYSACQGDCDDTNPNLSPLDADGDGYSICDGDCDDANALLNLADSDGDGYTTCDGDCDDNNQFINPGDNDGDGYSTCQGDCDDTNVALNPADSDGDGYSTCQGDCNDNEPGENPGNNEILFNGIDDDCNGNTVDYNSGIFESFVIVDNVFYDLDVETGNADFQNTDLGSVDCNETIILYGAKNRTFKCPTGNGDITNGKLFYSVYLEGGSPNFTELNLGFGSNDNDGLFGCQNQTWEELNAGINITDGLAAGSYTLEVYTSADYTYDGGAGTHYANNNGQNYKATFTVVGDTETPQANCVSDYTITLNDGTATLTVEEIDNGSTDNCGIASMSLSHTEFTCADIPTGSVGIEDLFFSEYGEGGSVNNKYLEIFNGSGNAISLAGYEIHRVSNGGSFPEAEISLSGTLMDGETAVVRNSSATAPVSSAGDINISSGNITHNGNDAYALVRISDDTIIDLVGDEGPDPGDGWDVAGINNATKDHVLIRKSSVISGNVNWEASRGSNITDSEWIVLADGDYSDIGSHAIDGGGDSSIPVTLTVTDDAGNASTCDANITIEFAAPLAICQDITVQLDADGLAEITAEQIDNGSEVACGAMSLSINNGQFDCSNLGPNTVILTVEDEYGSSSTCEATVTIEDNIAPTAICQNIIVALDENGQASITAEDVDNGSTDNCGINSLSIDIQSFDCSHIDNSVVIPENEIWINEFHYDNEDGDIDEFVEIAANFDASNHSLFFYNGNNGAAYNTIPLSGITAVAFGDYNLYLIQLPANGIQNGAPDGLALADENGVAIEFISYEGSFVATNGPAAGISSTDIGVSETGTTLEGYSLQLSGSGGSAADFTWQAPAQDTPGSPNNGQTLEPLPVAGNPVVLTVTDEGGNQSSCTAYVLVVDDQAPLANCENVTIELDANGEGVVTSAILAPNADDNCGIASVTLNNDYFDCSDISAEEFAQDLIISEYIEGSSGNNKYIEVYNGTSSSIDLSNYALVRYTNGSSTGSASDLSGTLASGEAAVFRNSSSTTFTGGTANSALTFNGDDAMVLRNNATEQNIDIIGKIGQDPGSAWTSGSLSTANSGLRRKPEIINGNTDNLSGFPALGLEWESYDDTDVSNLGSHTSIAGQVSPIVNEVLVTITDVNGNQSTCTSEVTVVDVTAPDVMCQNITLQLGAAGNASITPEQIDNGSNDACGIASLQLSQTEFDCGHLGANQVTLSVTDVNGNISSCTATVSVEDAMAPSITAPADLDITTDAGSCVAQNIGFEAAIGSDNCSGLVITSDAPAEFPLGETVVVWTATDVSGNIATAEQTVTVGDNETPTIIAPADISQPANAGVCFALINDLGSAIVSDNCEVLIPTNDAPASFPVGTTTVTWTVLDAAGNVATATQQVHILDEEAPTVVCVGEYTVQLNENGVGVINPTDLDDGSFDNCGEVSFSVDNASFDCSDLPEPAPVANDLFISEYIEGSASNKYIEIYNGTGGDVDLADYSLALYSNGSTSSNASSLAAAGILVNGEVAVFRNNQANIYSGTTFVVNAANFNGDDAIALVHNGTTIDVFGRIGQDPGSQWSVDGNMTANRTLVRIPTVTDGNTDNLSGFPSLGTEWVEFTTDYIDDLGQHTSVVGGPSTLSGIPVTLTVTDDAGNSSSCPVSITVEDNVAPNVICQDVDVYLDENGQAILSPSDVNNNSTDVCGIASMELNITEFDCDDLVAEENGPIAFINEFHYDNSGADIGEFVEVAVINTIDASEYSVFLYRESDGSSYSNELLGNPQNPNGDFNMYLIEYPSNGLQNGTAGIALSDDNGNLLEFISYEGSFTASGGPADGVTSTDVGVSEPGSSPAGSSIQRVGNGSAGANFTWTGPEAASPGTINNGQTFAPANLVNPVTLTVTDINGNSASCVASVNVIDNLPPVLAVQNVTVELDENGAATVAATDVDNGTEDNCTIESIELNANEFDCNNIGDNTLQFTASDQSGNTSSTDVIVTIEDNIAPEAICVETMEVELGPDGTATILAADVNDGSTDNCGVVGLSLSNSTFDCSDLPDNTPIEDAVWINEIHYDNNSTDTGEMVEVAANIDVSDYSIVLYNGNGGGVYATELLSSASIVNTTPSGFTFFSIVYSTNGLENGSPDGVALIDGQGNTVQFLSYEGTFTASNGPAAGITSTDIGVSENSSTPAGFSLQLAGTGNSYEDFTWQQPAAETPGGLNNNQNISGSSAGTEVILTVTDASGNASSCPTVVVVQDATDPIVACQDITVSLDANGEISILAADIDAGSYDACAGTDITTSISKSDFDCDDLGPQTVTLTVADGSGNTASCNSTVTIIDDLAPIAICQNIMVELDETGNAFISEMDVDGGSTDNCGIENYWVSLDRFDCSHLGDNIVELHVTDESGNTSICEAIVSVKDYVAPNAVCQNAIIYLDENGLGNIDVDDINNGSTDNCEIASISLSQTNFSCADVGIVEVTMTVTDGYDNVSTCVAQVTVIDNIAPTVTCQNQTLALGADGTLEINVGQVTTDFDDNCEIDYGTLSQSTFDCTNIGDNIIDVTVYDVSGNSSTCASTITIVDNTPPVALCQNITIQLDDMGEATITATDVDAGSSDNCSVASVSIDNSMFTCANIGPNNVVLTVTDGQGLTDYCTAIVTVEDNMAPTAICQAVSVTLDASGIATVSAESVNNGSSDNCGLASLSLSQSEFTCADLGSNAVTLTVTDVNGNISTCESTVTVNDETAPTMACSGITLELDENGMASLSTGMIDNGSSDNCGSVSLSLDITSFDCTNMGDNLVTLTGVDASGNTSTCTAIVTVVDTEAPDLSCQNLAVSLDETGFAMITAEQMSNPPSDNCGIASLEITSGPVQFGCEDENQVYTVTVTATDVNGNSSSCDAQVSIIVDQDADGDGVGDACDFCLGDDSAGDTDGDGICDDMDSCPGFDDMADPDANCDVSTTLNSWWYYAANGGTYCIDGPYNGGHITVVNGSTVRLSGSGHVSVSLYYGGKLEVMEGSDITFSYLGVHWGAAGMVVYPNAEVTYNGTFSPNADVVNCGTFTVRKLRVNYSGSFVNNGTLEIIHSYAKSTVHGDLINNGTLHTNGSLAVYHNGEFVNNCHAEIDDDLFVHRHVRNTAFINVGHTTRIYYHGRIHQYDGAMFQTSSNVQFGRILGNGSTSLFKVNQYTVGYWGSKVSGSVAYCDVDGIELLYANNYFQNGASEDCNVTIPVDGCNPNGHAPFFGPSEISVSSDDLEVIESTDLSVILTDDEKQMIAEHRGAITQLTVWPNPTKDKTTLTIVPANDDRMVVELYSVNGELVSRVFEGDAAKHSIITQEIDLSKYENGVYFIRVIESSDIQTKKIVLAR